MPAVIDPFAGLEPTAFWRHFETLTAIPRPTFGEERAAAHVIGWAAERGWETRRDATGNLVVPVPATPGREGAPVVVLQGHLDIVCERDPGSPYDPREGRIHVVRDGEWMHAVGTTLGADNGVAIAAMMAVAEDADAAHGPLELLMTVAEEVGMAGAAALDHDLIGGELLLNLDSEEDATLTVGCAGGADTLVHVDAPREPAGAEDVALRVAVSGGRGGHSGGDIAAGRANAIKVLARALAAVPGVRIASLAGGASRNAIPRDAAATVLVRDAAAAAEAIAAAGAAAVAPYDRTDPDVRVVVERAAAGDAAGAWAADASARILALIAALPCGLLGMSAEFPGAVETSTSIGVATTEDGRLTLANLTRSASDARLDEVLGAIGAAATLAGATAEPGHRYPAWRPDLNSPLLATATATHERLFGDKPHIQLTHGGLEPAMIGAPDMLSLGPLIEGPHAPGERVNIASAGRFMRLLTALLDVLSSR